MKRESTIFGVVHYFDAKGRQYRLNRLADELRSIGIKVIGTGFESDYDGYVEVEIDLEQTRILDKKYGTKFYICGRGNTIEEMFSDAVRINKICRQK